LGSVRERERKGHAAVGLVKKLADGGVHELNVWAPKGLMLLGLTLKLPRCLPLLLFRALTGRTPIKFHLRSRAPKGQLSCRLYSLPLLPVTSLSLPAVKCQPLHRSIVAAATVLVGVVVVEVVRRVHLLRLLLHLAASDSLVLGLPLSKAIY